MSNSRRQREERAARVSARRRIEEHQTSFAGTCFQKPEGFKSLAVKEECVKRLDILPYRVGKGNPFADPGQLHYERTFFTHARIGANENSYICPKKTAGKPCPICDHRAKLARDPDTKSELLKDLLPKERQLWIVVDHDDPSHKYLWDVSFHLFGKLLDNRIKNADEDDEYEFFADLEDGLTLRVAFEEKSIPGRKPFYAVASIDFKQRKEGYDSSLIDDLPCLDDLLIIESYEALEKIYFQEADDDEDDDNEDDDKPATSSRNRNRKRDDDDDDDDDEPAKKPSKKPAVKKQVDDEDDDDDEGDEEDEEPVKKPVAKKFAAKKQVDEEDEGDEEDDEPVKKPAKKPVAKKQDDDDDDVWDDEEPPFEAPKKTKGKQAVDEDDEEDEAPVKKPVAKKPAKKQVDDDDDEEPVKKKGSCVACGGTMKNSKGRPCMVCAKSKPSADADEGKKAAKKKETAADDDDWDNWED